MLLLMDDRVYSLLLTREKMVEISMPLLKRIGKVIQRALKDSAVERIDNVLMVGGSSKMYIVEHYIRHYFTLTPRVISSPDLIVAEGAGIYAGIKSRDADIRDMMMTDVCPFTLGIAAMNHRDDQRAHISTMIERNTILPSSALKRFFTLYDGQTRIDLDIYQGEALHADENLFLGSLTMDIPAAEAGREGVNVHFTYDINGILQVEAWHEKTNQHKERVIVGEYNALSPTEIVEKLSELEKLKSSPFDEEENKLLLARGERLYAELLGDKRKKIIYLLADFRRILQSNNRGRLARARVKLAAYLIICREQRRKMKMCLLIYLMIST